MAAPTAPQATSLPIALLSRASFAPFGEVIMLDGAKHYPINQGTTQRFHALAAIDTNAENGQGIISLFRAQPRSLPFQLSVIERHPLGSQAFIPMTRDSADEYLIVVAPPGEFKVENLQAFLGKGFEGVSYAKGVWHHPLIALHRVSDFLIVDRVGPGNNCDEIPLPAGLWLDAEELAKARANQL